jgi:hypothetical protein
MPAAGVDSSQRLESLDLTLFDVLPTQSTDGDRRSWLAVQRSVRRPAGYTYLEIGSHLGGSIQQHLIDPWCQKIISIDKRPPSQPDDPGETFCHERNSTARMLDHLRRIARHELSKVICFDADAKDVAPHAIPRRPDFCFIDGEHTHAAALSDFESALTSVPPTEPSASMMTGSSTTRWERPSLCSVTEVSHLPYGNLVATLSGSSCATATRRATRTSAVAHTMGFAGYSGAGSERRSPNGPSLPSDGSSDGSGPERRSPNHPLHLTLLQSRRRR